MNFRKAFTAPPRGEFLSKLTDEVFPHHYTFNAGYMHPGNAPGLGVDIDEALAAKHPYQRAYLPIARKLDGTLTDW